VTCLSERADALSRYINPGGHGIEGACGSSTLSSCPVSELVRSLKLNNWMLLCSFWMKFLFQAVEVVLLCSLRFESVGMLHLCPCVTTATDNHEDEYTYVQRGAKGTREPA
jgi:hypothetical protein